MMTPPETVDPLDSINAILSANVRQQKLLTESLRQPIFQEKKKKKMYERTLCFYIFNFLFRRERVKIADYVLDKNNSKSMTGNGNPVDFEFHSPGNKNSEGDAEAGEGGKRLI